MLNKTRVGLGMALFTFLTVIPVYSQEEATLALRNGERPSGELLDMNGSGFIMRVNGQDRSYPASEVRAVEFVVGPVPEQAQAKINAGQPFVLLRNGQLVDGRLSDVGGTHPLRLTISTASGTRDFTSNEVAQAWVNPEPARASGGRQAQQPADGQVVALPAGAITVPANVAWTDTGIMMNSRVPLSLTFTATGDVMIGPGASSGIGGSPAVTNPNLKYPLKGAPAGALIGRIGNGTPFLIGGNNQPMPLRGTGRLMLGVNDDQVADNSGSFHVSVRGGGR